jgi:energy-coupling factor transporter ATP-binding protein EcfA2
MAIELKDLRFSYPGRDVLDGITIDIKDGDFAGITGSTGSGKTTLAYCFNGLIPHAIRGKLKGSVKVAGIETRKAKISSLARKVGFVFQDPDWQLFSLSVRDEIEFGLKNLRMNNVDRRVSEALRMAGLEGCEESVPHRLSHGQKQLLCIASVLAMEPEIIVLDEPASQLDHRSTMNVYGILKRLNREGKTIIVIEHNTDLLTEYASRVMLLDDGKIAGNGRPKDVLSDRKMLNRLGVKIPEACR